MKFKVGDIVHPTSLNGLVGTVLAVGRDEIPVIYKVRWDKFGIGYYEEHMLVHATKLTKALREV